MRSIPLKSMLLAVGIVICIYSCIQHEQKNPSHSESIQPKNHRLYKMFYENASGEEGVTIFFYDDNGKNFRSRWELMDKSRFSYNYHTFDDNGYLIEKYREFSDSLTSRVTYEYNEQNQLIAEHFWRSDLVSGSAIYEYNEMGKQIKMRCNGYNGWMFGDISYEYNENEQRIKGTMKQGEKINSQITYEYNERGDIIKEYWDFGGQWSQTFTYEYEEIPIKPVTYTSSNGFIRENPTYRIKSEDYKYNNQGGGPSYFEYDKNGRLEQKTFIRADSLKTTTRYVFDDKGRLFSSHREYSNGRKATFFYNFNDDRTLRDKYFFRSDGIKGYEKYTYDENGKLIQADWKNMDSWLTGIITFEHNDKGQISVGHFKGDRFNAEITFEHDEVGNLIKYHWDFSFGQSQTYWLEYEKSE